jgi:hypothetical protein
MSSKDTVVFGIYPSADQAERAIDTLIAAGHPSAAISVLLPDSQGTREFAHQKDTKAPEGTTVGVTTGGVIGGTVGVLAGVGALVISHPRLRLWATRRVTHEWRDAEPVPGGRCRINDVS